MFFSLAAMLLVGASPASAQTFTVTATGFTPFAIEPGASAQSIVTVTPGTGFSGTVSLSCAVTNSAGITPSSQPVCQVTPSSVTPAATASLTVTGLTTTNTGALPGTYTVTVTGTQGSTTSQQSANITVLSAVAGFTITVTTPIQPTSVHAGSGATATITVTPLPGYSGNVTLACATVNPLVDLPPYCVFSYPKGAAALPITAAAATATLTINTYGPINTTRVQHFRGYFAAWLSLPMLVFVSLGATTLKRSRKAWGLLGLFILGGLILFIPACGTNTGSTVSNPIGNTPKNTYTFAITGVDSNGVIATNTTASSAAPTVTLTVN